MVELGGLLHHRFWREWKEKFEDNVDELINPNHPLVEEEAGKVEMVGCCGNNHPGLSVWQHIGETIDYKLSEKWKEPEETLKSGEGDCEDVDFLMLSMLPHFGVDQAHLVIGYLNPDSGGGAHTWVEFDGRVMDPTGMPGDAQGNTYEEVDRFTINFD